MQKIFCLYDRQQETNRKIDPYENRKLQLGLSMQFVRVSIDHHAHAISLVGVILKIKETHARQYVYLLCFLIFYNQMCLCKIDSTLVASS